MTSEGAIDLREGYNTIKAALCLSHKFKIEMPVLEATHDILFKGKGTESVISDLINHLVKDIEQDDFVKYTYDVFVCHSSRDKQKFNDILSIFKKNEVVYWIDHEQILPGYSIPGSLSEALKNSRYIIVCISENFDKTNWTYLEIENFLHARAGCCEQNKVIPIILDENCKENIPQLLKHIKYVTLFEEDGLNDLIKILKNKDTGR